MAKAEQMLRLKYIEELLRRKKEVGASYEEIEDYLEEKFREKDMLDQLSFTARTFQRDKNEIFKIFGIEISYNRALKKYVISNEELEDIEDNIFDNMLLVEAYRMTRNREDIVQFEKRRARGLNHLHGLIHAIQNKNIVSFDYEKFWDNDVRNRSVKPYALKEFRHRWYLLAQDYDVKTEQNIMKTFGLDRISNLDIKNTSFKRENYDAEKEFKNSFGIIAPNGKKPQEIILSFHKEQGNYIKALPIHHSQKILVDNDDEIRVSVFLVPTFDFEREILSLGQNVKILEPESFKEHLKKEVENMLTQFS